MLEDIEKERQQFRAEWRRSGWHRGINMIEALHQNFAARADSRMKFLAPGHEADLTLRELYDEGDRIATALQEFGVQPHGRVAVQVPNWSEAVAALYAAFLLRLVVVPIPAIYGPTEVKFILEDADVGTYVMADRWRSNDYTGSLSTVSSARSLERVIVVGDDVPSGCISWSEVRDRAATSDPTPVGTNHEDGSELSFIVYTSGSTSNPKGSRYSHDTFLAEFKQQRKLHSRKGSHLLAYPGGHVAGLLETVGPLLYGGDTLVVDTWDADQAAQLISDLGLGSVSGAPYYLATLLDAADRQGCSLRSIRDCMVGSTAVPPSLVERAEEAGFHPYRCYGSTEHPTICSNVPADSLADRSRTDGPLAAGVDVRIVDEEDHPVPRGSEGEILSRGPDQFLGYTDPSASAAAFTSGGWFRTGDIGWLTPSWPACYQRPEKGRHHPRRREPLLPGDRRHPQPPPRGLPGRCRRGA